MLTREQDPALGPQDVRLERGLLPRREQGERAARPSVAVPGVGSAALVDVPDAGMDPGHVVERLLEPGLLVHGTPLERVLAPRVRGEQHAARRGRVGGRVVMRRIGRSVTVAPPTMPSSVSQTRSRTPSGSWSRRGS